MHSQDKKFKPHFKATNEDTAARYRAEGQFSPQTQQTIRAIARLRRSSVEEMGETWLQPRDGAAAASAAVPLKPPGEAEAGASSELELEEDIDTLEEELFGREGQVLPH